MTVNRIRIPVRACYRTVRARDRTAPHDTLTLKIYYPSKYGGSAAELDTGFIPADAARAPFPVAIVMPGINIPQEAYGWLAAALSRAGFVAVTYTWVTIDMGDTISASPGLTLDALHRHKYGSGPSCPALPAIFKELERMRESSLLAGLLDLDRVVLGGHSAGGAMALLNANNDWFPGIRAAFAYAGHTAGNPRLGWPEHSIMPLTGNLPLLIMGGNQDGVISGSSHRYGAAADSHGPGPVERTFREGVAGNGGGRHLLIVDGANHFSFVWPNDPSTGRAYLERPAISDGRRLRAYMVKLIVNFCGRACGDAAAGAVVEELCNAAHPLAAVAETK